MSTTVRTHGIAGDHGYRGQSASAIVLLKWSNDSGWYLDATSSLSGDGQPIDEYYGIVCSYELHCADFLSLRDDDGSLFLDPLGEDLPQLLERISSGHSVDWDDQQRIVRLTADAQDAVETLIQRIDDVEYERELPQMWHADEWLSEYDFEPDDTAASLLAAADPEGVRIWGGEAAIQEVIAERAANNTSEEQ